MPTQKVELQPRVEAGGEHAVGRSTLGQAPASPVCKWAREGELASIREQREVWGGVSPERFYDNNDMPGRAHWMAVATHEPHPHSFQSLHFRVT